MNDTIEVPRGPLIDYLVALARENSTVADHTSPPERGVEGDVEWSWNDVEWEIESFPNDGRLSLRGITEGDYSVKTKRAITNAPPSECRRAEYENRTTPVRVEIDVEIGGGSAIELGTPHVEVYRA